MEGFRWMRGARGLGAALVFLGFGAALLAYPAQVQRGLAQSVLYCLASLVPSLFPFMVLASFGVRSGAGEVLGKLLGPVTRRLFRLPRACGATVLLSFLGGYPAGARGVSLLLEQGKITREQAGRMLCFCVAPGAAFVVTFVGWGLLGSLRLGWLLFGAVTLSGLLLGLLTGLGKPVPQEPPPSPPEERAGALIRSVGDASSATVKMCGCILLFAGILAVLQGSGLFQRMAHALAATGWLLPSQAAACLAFLLEVTGGTGEASRQGGGAVVLRLWPGLWGAVRSHAGIRLFPGVPPGEGEVLPGPAAPRPGGNGDVPAFRAAVPRAQPAGVGRRGQRPGVRTDGLHGGGGTLPAADVPGLFGGAPAKAVKLPCPRAGAVL